MLKEHGDKVSADVREKIEAKRKAVVRRGRAEAPGRHQGDRGVHGDQPELGQKIYEEAAKAPRRPRGRATTGARRSGRAAPKPADDVIDADFEKK
jgi:hypothetical protein